jgi:hypothetical protein
MENDEKKKLSCSEKVAAYLREKNRKEQSTRRTYKNFEWPASDAGKCVRQLCFSRRIPKEKDDESLRNFAIGSILHDWFQRNIYTDGPIEERMLIFDKGILVRGRCDYENGEEVVDFKTCKVFPAGKEARDHHKMQLIFYMRVLGIEGKIVYIVKDDLSTQERDVKFDQALYDEALQIFMEARDHLDRGSIPPRLKKYPYHWQCEWCDWREECDKAE